MTAPSSTSSSSAAAADSFQKFLSEVKELEQSYWEVLTAERQISRLLRPGSTYANLNPFDVLLLGPETTGEQVRKQYKRLSILLHPDKNPDDRERAQKAFDILNKAYKTLDDDESRQKAVEVYEEATFKVKHMMEEKRRKLKKEGRATIVEEDDPNKYRQAIKVMSMKLFADYERKRRHQQERAQEERKRTRETEIEEEEMKRLQKEWEKMFEESRESRVSSWKSFQDNAKTSNKRVKRSHAFRPPKHKAESR